MKRPILFLSLPLPKSYTHLLKSPQCVKNATIVFFPPEGKASAREVGLPVAALKTWLCFSSEYSGDAGSDFMIEKGEDSMIVMLERGLVKVGAAEEGCCLLSWPRGEVGGTNAWQHVLADRAAASKANFERQEAMLWCVCRCGIVF